MDVCDDCGRVIVQHRERWAEQTDKGWNFFCRVTIVMDDDVPVLLSADYHYIEGETQQLFRHVIPKNGEA